MEFTRKELALIETVMSTSKLALLKHLKELPPETPDSVLKPFWEFDDQVGALLDKLRARKKRS